MAKPAIEALPPEVPVNAAPHARGLAAETANTTAASPTGRDRHDAPESSTVIVPSDESGPASDQFTDPRVDIGLLESFIQRPFATTPLAPTDVTPMAAASANPPAGDSVIAPASRIDVSHNNAFSESTSDDSANDDEDGWYWDDASDDWPDVDVLVKGPVALCNRDINDNTEMIAAFLAAGMSMGIIIGERNAGSSSSGTPDYRARRCDRADP